MEWLAGGPFVQGRQRIEGFPPAVSRGIKGRHAGRGWVERRWQLTLGGTSPLQCGLSTVTGQK